MTAVQMDQLINNGDKYLEGLWEVDLNKEQWLSCFEGVERESCLPFLMLA